MARGALIVFEGVDRSGKTTQSKQVVNYLKTKGINCEWLRFPDRENLKTGPLISTYLKNGVDLDDHVIHLLFSANRWECAKIMEKKLSDGITLVIDRYAFSGVAYTASKPNMDLEWCKQPDRGLPDPDAVVYLDIDIAAASGRADFGEERYDKIEFQKSVRSIYNSLLDPTSWTLINADRPLETISTEVNEICQKVVEKVAKENLPLGKLWM